MPFVRKTFVFVTTRFRSAREALETEKKAQERGEALPKDEKFDSNCITPGTEFMARLDAQLQYFVTSKISYDKMWQNCKVIYSGHQVRGILMFMFFCGIAYTLVGIAFEIWKIPVLGFDTPLKMIFFVSLGHIMG